jgi:YHS domain-containing protein
MEHFMTHLLRLDRVVPFALALAIVSAGAAAAPKPVVNISRGELALRGYDTVAYWTEGRPVRGSTQFEHRWNGAVWRFATAEHRDRFAQDPERYAPQFGGYCAYAVSRGYTADGDPTVWRIVDAQLYVNYSRRAQTLWEQDIPGNIVQGRRNWPGVLGR